MVSSLSVDPKVFAIDPFPLPKSSLINSKELLQAQLNDPAINKVLNFVNSGQKPSNKLFFVNHGKLNVYFAIGINFK